jgi:hypothetical protein
MACDTRTVDAKCGDNPVPAQHPAAILMSNPVLVEVTRGNLVESRHHGAVAVVDADGARVLALGDVAAPVFPRSAIKALQALVLVEAGAVERYGLADEEPRARFCALCDRPSAGCAARRGCGRRAPQRFMMAAVIARLPPPEERGGDFLARFVRPVLRNWRGMVVGASGRRSCCGPNSHAPQSVASGTNNSSIGMGRAMKFCSTMYRTSASSVGRLGSIP